MGSQPLPDETRLGAYTLIERVGEGGFARVYQARGPDGDVAVKILAAQEGSLDEGALKRFEREIELLAKVRHPGLVSLLDSGVDPAHGPYLVMPLLVGLTFRDVLPDEGLGPEGGVRLITPVVQALGALHAAGLVHRDLKPENVIVSPRGEVTLVDLGLALGVEQSRLTQTGAVAGSVPYMAPEQIEGDDPCTQSDVWSSGVLLYELITGRRPFARKRAGEEVAAILGGSFTPLIELDRRVSTALDELVTRCLTQDRDARPADAHELLQELESLLDWAPPAAQKREVVSVLSDLAAYQKARAEQRIAQLHDDAERAAQTGDTFAALALLDRALAYRPENADTLSKIEAVSSGTVLPKSAIVTKKASVRPGVRPAAVDAHGPTRVAPVTSSNSSSSRVSMPHLWPWIAIAILGLLGAGSLGAWLQSESEADGTQSESNAGDETETSEAEDEDEVEVATEDEGGTFEPDFVDPLAPPRPDPAVLSGSMPGLDQLRPIPAQDLAGGERIDMANNVRRDGETLIPVSMLGERGAAGALAYLEAQMEAHPSNPDFRVGHALALLGNGREREGLAELESLSTSLPNVAVLWGSRGYVSMRLGDFEAADRYLSRAIRLDPSNATALRNRGILRHRMARRAEGYADLRSALRYDPNDINALSELAQIYERTGHRMDARPLLERVVRLRPNHAEAWVDLSMAQPDAEEALASVDRAIEVMPAYRRAYVRRCTILARAQHDDAVDACTRAMEAAPNDPWMQMQRGLAHYHRSETEPALRDMNAAISRRPNNPEMLTNRYFVLQHAGRVTEARADLQKACDLGHEPACNSLRE